MVNVGKAPQADIMYDNEDIEKNVNGKG